MHLHQIKAIIKHALIISLTILQPQVIPLLFFSVWLVINICALPRVAPLRHIIPYNLSGKPLFCYESTM